MLAVGLTGGIGSGKSTISAALLSRGAVIVDADVIARSLQEPGMVVFRAMVDRFGESIVGIDGRLDRQAVAAIVFNDAEALEDLNRIVHPRVGEAIVTAIAATNDDDIVVLDIPLLVEGLLKTGKSNYDVAAILVVDCPVDVQVERLTSQRGFDTDDARARIANQVSREERAAVADFTIDNGGPIDALTAQIDDAWTWMTNLRLTGNEVNMPADTPDLDLTASAVAWDLSTIVEPEGGAGVEALIEAAAVVADDIATYRGRIAELDVDEFVTLMRLVEQHHEHVTRAASYAQLRFAVDTSDGALLQSVQEQAARLSTKILFVDLEWAALDDAAVEVLLTHDALGFCAHYLRGERRYRTHLLSEPEEAILAEKSVTGAGAWSRLFSQLTSEISVELQDDEVANRVSLEEALSLLAAPDSSTRADAAAAITTALNNGLSTRAFVFNTLLQDKSITDRLRSYPTWLSSRNLSNETTDESVQALVDAVVSRYDIPQRWYRLKAQILGRELFDYDRMASVAETETRVGWAEATEIVLDAYAAFSPELASTAKRFFDERWIDAPIRPAKRPGAFCSYTVPSHHPYVFLNWTGRPRDVMTLAHELGHGCHAYMSRPQGVFHFQTPLTLAETASVFGETLTFQAMLDATSDPRDRLALLAENIEGSIATVFRQTAMNRFEDAVHVERREVGELSTDRFGDLWIDSQRDMLGGSVTLSDGYRNWWSYIPHFIGTPGYVYAYAYGQLLALSVYGQYTSQGSDFVSRYLALLASGGSMSPEELGRIVGCDLGDPRFWMGGLELVEEQLDLAEAAWDELKPSVLS